MQVPLALDFHCHLRQGDLMKHVCSRLESGGAQLALVMPNTQPPTTTSDMAVEYRAKLVAENPRILYLMTLYLTAELDTDQKKSQKKGSNTSSLI